jgi:hypothetical protein
VSPWKLPPIVAAIAVPALFAIYLGGPGAGLTVGALVSVGIVFVAVRQRPRGGIGRPPAAASPPRVLIVLAAALEDPRAVEQTAVAVGVEPGTETVILAPARIGFLDRWASDVEGARRAAQERLVISVASLAAAGIEAEARVGDEDLVQAVEDQLGSFDATDVILFGADPEVDPAAAAAAEELDSRLRARFRWIRVSDPAAR